jgi:cell wall-associated NlpC family hydrolase
VSRRADSDASPGRRIVTASDLIAAARALMGTKFRHQGRNPATGLDCIGLFIVAGQRAGLLPPEFERTDYARTPSDLLEQRLRVHCELLERPEPGALAAIRWPGDRRAAHVAICTEGGNLLHCYSDAGEVVEHGHRAQWLRWTTSVWWPRGLSRG